jgi:hypothetical protein
MVQSREALKIIADTLRRSSKMPEEMSYILHEPDPDGEDSAVSVPVTVLQDTDTTRDDPSNSNFEGYLLNDSGERVGTVYETKWEMSLQIDIWTAAGSDYNVDKLGKELHEVLYAYDTRGPDKTFVDGTGEGRELIYDFTLQDSNRDDNLDQTPSVRRWRQLARVRGAERLTTTSDDPPVRNVTQQ